MLKIARMFLLVLLVAMAVPSFAFNGADLSKAMDTAAYAGQYLCEIMHPGMPKPWTNPMYMTMMNKVSESWKVIDKEISSIETEKEIANARAIVELYKSMKGTYRDLGHQVEISLNERIKFLEAHSA
ncbi:MAG: hypothetical protein EOM80_11175 [Erysipelotrichia bacterium]|nr:hypothetical protein [Candidatus Riflebacteria bacterium]NCB39317.1 hypothetical protein [Erysipelotrichia bacterium]